MVWDLNWPAKLIDELCKAPDEANMPTIEEFMHMYFFLHSSSLPSRATFIIIVAVPR